MHHDKPASLYPHCTTHRLRGERWAATVCAAHMRGEPSAQRFLLIHGNPSHLDDWAHTVPALLTLGDVAVYDQVGFGRSARLEGREATLNACADVALALADQLGWTRFVVCGQSHGGMVAHTLAARAPGRIEALVLLGTGGVPAHGSYRLLATPGVRQGLRWVGGPVFRWRALRLLAAAATSAALRRSYEPDAIPMDLLDEHLHAFAERPEVLEVMAELAQHGPCEQVAQQVAHIRAPALFIHGRDDQLVPIACAQRLYELTARHTQATFCGLAGGHMVHYSRAPEVNRLLLEWLHALA
jgi:2-hydroxymuconate-semialdehyde hydrolase